MSKSHTSLLGDLTKELEVTCPRCDTVVWEGAVSADSDEKTIVSALQKQHAKVCEGLPE